MLTSRICSSIASRWIDVSEALLDALSEPDRGRIRQANAAVFTA
jgi:hypothetical protein